MYDILHRKKKEKKSSTKKKHNFSIFPNKRMYYTFCTVYTRKYNDYYGIDEVK